MKNLTLIFLISVLQLHAQTWQWSMNGGGTGGCNVGGGSCSVSDYIKHVITDERGNSYFIASGVGSATDSLRVGNKKVYLNGSQDILYGKIDCSGKVVWLKVMGSGYGGTRSDQDRAQSISMDRFGHLFIFGEYYTSLGYPFKIDKDTFISRTAPWVGQSLGIGGFALKLDTNGKMISLNVFCPDQGNPFLSTVCDEDGFIWSMVGGSKKYLPTDSFPEYAIYLTKLDPNSFRPIKSFQVTPKNKIVYNGEQYNFRIDKNKNTYFCVRKIADSLLLGNNKYYEVSAIVKFDSNGVNTFSWIGRDNPRTAKPDDAFINDIQFDQDGDYYINYYGNLGLINDDSIRCEFSSGFGDYDGRGVVKYSGKTNKLVWYKLLSAFGDFTTEGYSIALLPDKTSVIPTVFRTYKYETSTLNSKILSDMLLIFIDSTGNVKKTEMIYAETNLGTLERLTTDQKGNLYVFGKMFADTYIGNDTLKKIGGETDFFMAKYGQANCYCPSLKASCAITDSSVKRTLSMNFTGSGADSVVFFWGDGTQTKGINPTHLYAKDTIYTIKVVAYNSCYQTDVSYLTHSFMKTVSVVNLFPENQISIYPNPVTEFLTIRFASKIENDIQVIIRNALGAIEYSGIYPKGALEQKINLESFTTGIYLVEIRENNELRYQEKIVK